MATATKMRGLCLKAWEVRAFLESRKTQRRTVVKRNPPFERDGMFEWYPGGEKAGFHAQKGSSSVFDVPSGWAASWCPFGKPGARFYGKETFSISSDSHDPDGHYWMTYESDGAQLEIDGSEVAMGRLKPGKRYSSVTMPAWASRLTLELVDVRVERLQEITESDAEAEGFKAGWLNDAMPATDIGGGFTMSSPGTYASASGKFAIHWIETCGPGSWERNDWVWVPNFRKIGG